MYSTEFDKEFIKINHYKKFPQLIPFVGENYSDNVSYRILLVAESHYLPDYSEKSLDCEKWYSQHPIELDQEEINHTETREVVNTIWDKNGHMLFRELEKNLALFIPKYNGRSINSCAFMNAFQRPSKNGITIKHFAKQTDFIVANKILKEVIKIINPSLVIFVSKYAWDSVGYEIAKSFPKIRFEFVCHPGTGGRYWHNPNYKHGIEKFKSILKNKTNIA